MDPVKNPQKVILAGCSLLIIVSTLGLGVQYLTKPPAPTSNLKYMIICWTGYGRGVSRPWCGLRRWMIVRGTIKDVEYEGLGSNVESKYLFKPHWVVKGLSTLRAIWVYQSGGITPLGETYVAFGNPLMQVGDVLILFLHEWAPRKYYVVGGPQGRFMVQGGRVYSIGEVYESPNELVQREVKGMTQHLHTGGVRELEFFRQLYAALNQN